MGLGTVGVGVSLTGCLPIMVGMMMYAHMDNKQQCYQLVNNPAFAEKMKDPMYLEAFKTHCGGFSEFVGIEATSQQDLTGAEVVAGEESEGMEATSQLPSALSAAEAAMFETFKFANEPDIEY